MAVFLDARILVCIRNQFEMIESTYKQYVTEGGTLSFIALSALSRPASLITGSRDHFRYGRMLELYMKLFGSERVQVVAFEQLRQSPVAFLRQVSDFLGVEPYLLSESQIAHQANRGLCPRSLALMRLLNRFLGSRFNLAPLISRRWVTSASARAFIKTHLDHRLRRFSRRSKDLLGEDLRCELREQYAQGNREVAERFAIPLDRLGYPF